MCQMVHLFLVLMAILKNQVLSMRTVLLFPYMILLLQKVFYLVFTKNKSQQGNGFGKECFQELYSS